MDELQQLARDALRQMDIPKKRSSLYPMLHKIAYSLPWPNGAEAVGAVFRELCTAIGATYGSQYMGNVINSRFDDGTLEGLLRNIPR
jgi:hypothetical protein